MSHFSVLVIGENIEAQLQPYHEFESTGTDDQFVQDIDITEDVRKEWEEDTTTMIRVGDDLVSAYDDRFYRDFAPEERAKLGPLPLGAGWGHGMSWSSRDWGDGQGYRAKVHDISGHEEVQIPTREVETFAEWMEDWHGKKCIKEGLNPDLKKKHKYGYAVIDKAGNLVKAINRTNPNKRWDYWRVGGRYGGRLILNPGAVGHKEPAGWDSPKCVSASGVADQARKGDIDFAAMRRRAEDRAGSLWDQANAITKGEKWESWERVREVIHKDDIEVARSFYHAQAAVKALKESKVDELRWDLDDTLCASREDYVKAAGDRSFSAFAVVKDGQWFKRGKMGWWACVSDENEQGEWQAEFNKLLDGLPDDTLLTIVDCHI